MDITGKTTVCGVIGDPVEHSMSPAMQNAAFRNLGLDYVYVPFAVKKEDLGNAISGMRALRMRGLNVTIPHKMAVMQFLDKLDVLAREIRAVNTIVNDGGTLTGYNTDAPGFLQPLLETGFEIQDKQVLIIGAGGAARAVAFALIERGAKLLILNRTADRANELARQLSLQAPGMALGAQLNDENLLEAMPATAMIVNATSVGMGDARDDTPVPAGLLHSDILVYDIVYSPMRTRLLSEAQAAGCRTIGGADMLAWQGAFSFELWTGQKAPIELMKQEVIRHLTDEK